VPGGGLFNRVSEGVSAVLGRFQRGVPSQLFIRERALMGRSVELWRGRTHPCDVLAIIVVLVILRGRQGRREYERLVVFRLDVF